MAVLQDMGLSLEDIATAGTDMDFFKDNVRFFDLNTRSMRRQHRQQLEVMQRAVELLKYVWPSCVPWGSVAPSLNVVRSLICDAVSGVGHDYGEVALRQSDNLRRACAAAEDARVAILAAVEQTLVARPGFNDSGYRKGGAPGFNDTTDVKWRAYTLACVHLVARTKALIVAQSEARVQFEAWELGQAGPAVFATACGGYPLEHFVIEMALLYSPADEEGLLKAVRGMHRHATEAVAQTMSSPFFNVLPNHAIVHADIARTEFYASVRDLWEKLIVHTMALRKDDAWPVELTLASARFKEAVPQLVKLAEWRNRALGWQLDGSSLGFTPA
jgi:hypothetical protein